MTRNSVFAAAITAASFASSAAAAPVALTFDPAAGGVNSGTLAVSGTGFSGSGRTDISGTVLLDVAFAADGVTPQSVQFLNSTDLSFSDVQIGPGGALGGTMGARGTATSGVLPIGSGGTVDAAGTLLIADEGTLRLGADTRDLAASPLTFTLDNTSDLTLALNRLGNIVTFTVTGSISGSAVEGATTYTATADQISARGSLTVPEPASLLIAAPAGLLLVRRRR